MIKNLVLKKYFKIIKIFFQLPIIVYKVIKFSKFFFLFLLKKKNYLVNQGYDVKI